MSTEPIYLPPPVDDPANLSTPTPLQTAPDWMSGQYSPFASPPDFAPSPTQQSQSNLAAMLGAAQMVEQPSAIPTASFPVDPTQAIYDPIATADAGHQHFQRGGSVNTGYDYQDPQRVLGNPKVQGSQRVYMGHSTEEFVASDPDAVKPTITKSKVNSITEAQAFNLPYQWYGDKDKINKLETALRKAGYKINSFDDAVKAWQGAVSTASNVYAASKGHSLVTPWDVLENQAKSYANGPGNTHVQTTTRVNDLTEGQAWQVLRGTMQQMLGRDPTQDEVNQFLAKANNDAANSPSTSTTTTKINPQTGRSHSSTTTDQGYTSADAQQAAYNELHNSADYGHYQAATTYFNALLSAVGEAAGSQ